MKVGPLTFSHLINTIVKPKTGLDTKIKIVKIVMFTKKKKKTMNLSIMSKELHMAVLLCKTDDDETQQ